jgi:hypothetical protein
MLEILQPLLANKNKTGLLYLTLVKIHTREVELVSEDQISNVLIVVQTMLEIIQVTSYLLEARISKTRETKFNSITNRWIPKIKIHPKSKWLLRQVTRFINKLLNMEEIILILMEIKFKDNKILWKTKSY